MQGKQVMTGEPAAVLDRAGWNPPASAAYQEMLREEVSAFVARQVLERDAQFFDG